MERWHRAFTKNDADFKELFGVKKEIFQEMLAILTDAREKRRQKGGPRRTKLSVGDQLFPPVQYWREYRPMAHLGYDFGISKSTVSDIIALVENVLIRSGAFRLPGKKALLSAQNTGRTLAVDVTESPIERPKKKQKIWYSGKKKEHSIKTQIVADVDTQEILCTAQEKGNVHDFNLFKATIRAIICGILLLADSGYQGLLALHANSRIPYKKSKNHPLTVEQKLFNRELSKERIVIENINAKIKTFKIMSERYRNRRKRHLLRMNLICAILNKERLIGAV
jgi:transposase